MKLVSRVSLGIALSTGALFGVSASSAKAAEAHITYLTSVHAYPTQGSPYNIIFYSYGCSWSGAGRMAIATLDWYQPSTWTNIFTQGYMSAPSEITGSKNDIFRASGSNNYYKLEVQVIDMAAPFTLYADVTRVSFTP